MLANGVAEGAPFFRDRDRVWSIEMDTGEVLDLTVDWTGWLAGDTISTSTWSVENITKNSDSKTTTAATAWLTAVSDPRGKAENTIVTAAGRTKQITIRVYHTVR